jgi:HlyD family secretion protein
MTTAGRSPWPRRLALAGAGALAIAALAWAFAPSPPRVATAVVGRGSLVEELVEDGVARVRDRYVITAPIPGTLLRPTHRPGDAVEPEHVVASLAPTTSPLLDARSRAEAALRAASARDARAQAQAAVAMASMNQSLAERELARVEALGEHASPRDRDVATARARIAAAEVASARFAAEVAAHEAALAASVLERGAEDAAEELLVTSPVDGVVLRVHQSSAGVVAPGTPLLELGDPRALEVVVDVLTPDAVRIPPNARVTIERWGGAPLEARVDRVEPAAFTRISALGVEEQRVNVVIDLVSPPEERAALGDGYRVEARIVLDRRDDAVRVPESAVFRRGDGHAVFIVAGGRATLTPVTLGLRTGREAEVVEGLAAGDVVIVHPGESVADGARVEAVGVSAADATP